MPVVKTILRELLGLFVDDGSVVLALAAWVLGCAAVLHSGVIGRAAVAVALSAGIVLLLAENVLRAARAHRARQAGR